MLVNGYKLYKKIKLFFLYEMLKRVIIKELS